MASLCVHEELPTFPPPSTSIYIFNIDTSSFCLVARIWRRSWQPSPGCGVCVGRQPRTCRSQRSWCGMSDALATDAAFGGAPLLVVVLAVALVGT
eukprot:4569352-Prymnesium_polylepis.1